MCCTLRNQFPRCIEIVLKTLMITNIFTCLSLNYILCSQMKELGNLVLNPQYLGDMITLECHLIVEYKWWMKEDWISYRQHVA